MEYQSGRKVFLPVGFTGSFSGNGRTNPTQNLVDAYEMSNGKRIDENGSTYDAANPYKDRDPRLAQTIFYQGMMWDVPTKKKDVPSTYATTRMRTKEWITPQPWEAPTPDTI